MNRRDPETWRRDGLTSALDGSPSRRTGGEGDWLLWQLVDSALPTGGFAHSAGLEGAWQHGEVRNRIELISWIEAGLHQLGHSQLPFVTAAHAEPGRFEEWDRLCDAFTANHVANRASRAQGRAFAAAIERAFGGGESGEGARFIVAGKASATRTAPARPFGHFAPVFGTNLRRCEVARETTVRLFFFYPLRGVLAAAVRLNLVGPLEAQAIQRRLAVPAEQIASDCAGLAVDDIAQTAPLLELWQGAHDRLYSRLFQS